MRRLKREWRDKPLFTRRVRWYANEEDTDIRLQFIDSEGETRRYYTDAKLATADWDDFKSGLKCVANFR